VLGREASDEAMLHANDTIRKMFAYRHDLLKALIADGVRLVVLGENESLADLPEFASLPNQPHSRKEKEKVEDQELDLLARTLDYRPDTKLLVVSEENTLADPATPQIGSNQVIRVFARAIHQVAGTRPVDPNWEDRGRDVQQYELRVKRLDVEFDKRLNNLYERAINGGKWKGTAAVHDPVTYWTTGVLAYFDALGQDAAPHDASHPIGTREALERYDPELFELVNETMAYEGHVDWRYKPAGGKES
jgi:hypothetical protein